MAVAKHAGGTVIAIIQIHRYTRCAKLCKHKYTCQFVSDVALAKREQNTQTAISSLMQTAQLYMKAETMIM